MGPAKGARPSAATSKNKNKANKIDKKQCFRRYLYMHTKSTFVVTCSTVSYRPLLEYIAAVLHPTPLDEVPCPESDQRRDTALARQFKVSPSLLMLFLATKHLPRLTIFALTSDMDPLHLEPALQT